MSFKICFNLTRIKQTLRIIILTIIIYVTCRLFNIFNSKHASKNAKFILLWTGQSDAPFSRMGDPITIRLEEKLNRKRKLVAWFVSNCHSKSGREYYVERLQAELKLFGHSVNVFGYCGPNKCPKGTQFCTKILRDHYFYLAFENSFAEDYVTEKVLTALSNYVVPIVYGGANYSRFLPPGSYLNARELSQKQLARQMVYIMGNSSRYHDFFRWRNHYSFRETRPLEEVCRLCKMLNDDEKFSLLTTWKDFTTWWNEDIC